MRGGALLSGSWEGRSHSKASGARWRWRDKLPSDGRRVSILRARDTPESAVLFLLSRAALSVEACPRSEADRSIPEQARFVASAGMLMDFAAASSTSAPRLAALVQHKSMECLRLID